MKRILITSLVAANVLLAVSLFAPRAQTPVMAATSSTLAEGKECCKSDVTSFEPYCCRTCCWTNSGCDNC